MDSIIIDTSSILFGLSNRVDIFKRVEEQLNLTPVISQGVVNELAGLAKSKTSEQKYAKVALSMIESYKIRVEKDEVYVDKWILSKAKAFGNVCTNDTQLRKELKSRGINTYALSREGTLR